MYKMWFSVQYIQKRKVVCRVVAKNMQNHTYEQEFRNSNVSQYRTNAQICLHIQKAIISQQFYSLQHITNRN